MRAVIDTNKQVILVKEGRKIVRKQKFDIVETTVNFSNNTITYTEGTTEGKIQVDGEVDII